jgi:DNA-binding MarR family transcriptional regulator
MDAYPPELVRAVEALRELLLAGDSYRQSAATFLGLGTSETQAVSYLYSRGTLGQNELGTLLGINTSSATALVDRLERNKIAERIAHPTDRRRYLVRLTTEGHAIVRSAGRWFVRAFDHIDPDRLPEFTAMLDAVATDLRTNASRIDDAPPRVAAGAPPTRRR